MIRLRRANIQYKDSFIKAVKEVQSSPEVNESTKWYKDLDIKYLENNFEEYVEKILSEERGENLKAGYVPVTMFWIIEDSSKYVGRISLRHSLTDFLKTYGGHIGYDIIPSERKNGHATRALKLCLREAIKLDIDQVLLTCDKNNIASSKVIKNNGGIYQGEGVVEGHKEITMRFIIEL